MSWSQRDVHGVVGGNTGMSQITAVAKLVHDKLREDVTFASEKIAQVHIDFDWHWILGSCIALCAAIMANTGLNLQKLSHLENTYYDPFTRKRPRPQSEKDGMMT